MQFRFVHAADIHLGNEQYNLVARADDFARAYLAMVDHAISRKVDFVLIAGDLFHHVQADAWTFKQALAGLALLREADIPVVAIEGNHDTVYAQKHLSWLGLLGDQGYLHLLNVQRADSGLVRLVPYDQDEGVGSYLDVAGGR